MASRRDDAVAIPGDIKRFGDGLYNWFGPDFCRVRFAMRERIPGQPKAETFLMRGLFAESFFLPETCSTQQVNDDVEMIANQWRMREGRIYGCYPTLHKGLAEKEDENIV